MSDLTRQLRGRQVVALMTNGHLLAIKMKDGAEVTIKWVDANGATIKGMPVVESKGFRMRCEGAREIVSGLSLGIQP